MGKLPLEQAQESNLNNSATDSTSSSQKLLIYIIDVGQGDATLILGPKNNGARTSLLIDAGRLDPDGGAIVEQLLQDVGLTELNYVLLTHYDSDHMGGFVTAYDSTSVLWESDCEPKTFFPTEAIIDLGVSDKDTDSVLEYTACRDANLDLLSEGHVVVGTPAKANLDYEIDLDSNYTATIVAGNGYVIDQDEQVANVDTDNEQSIAVLVSGPGDFHFLVTGDLTGQTYSNEDAAVESALGQALKARGIDVSVLRVGHHGSATSSAPDFLQNIDPEVAIISVGRNSYGHPNCDVLADLQKYSELVLQTEEGNLENCSDQSEVVTANGNILITVEEGEYVIETPDLKKLFGS